MSVTLDDVKLARKRAYDRVDYWLQKYRGMTIHEAGISIPRIPKDLHPSEYGEWYDYFESFTGAQKEGGTEDYLEGENEPPDLDPEYHPEPEPIEPDFPEEPEPPEPAEDDWTSDDVSEAIDNTLNGDDDYWWDYGAYDYDDIAPDSVNIEDDILDVAYGISPETGDAMTEALNNIREHFENIDDIDAYESGLEDVFNDSYLWDNLQRASQYRARQERAGDMAADFDFYEEVNRALSKLYRHFGMKYYREY